jgi:hypothetical protein
MSNTELKAAAMRLEPYFNHWSASTPEGCFEMAKAELIERLNKDIENTKELTVEDFVKYRYGDVN